MQPQNIPENAPPVVPPTPAYAPPPVHYPTPASQDNGLAIASMILGIVSLTGPGFILGIPALILGIVGLKKNHGGQGMSIAGIITGGISTVFSLLFWGFVIYIMIATGAYNETSPAPYYESAPYSSSET